MISQVIEKLHSGRVPQVGRAARPATLLQGSGKAVCVLTGGAGHNNKNERGDELTRLVNCTGPGEGDFARPLDWEIEGSGQSKSIREE